MKKHPLIFLSTPVTEKYRKFRREFANLTNAFGFEIILTEKEKNEGRNFTEKIESLLKNSDLLIADITEENAHVSFELGYVSALHTPVIVIIEKDKMPGRIPAVFIEKYPILMYKPNDLKSLMDSIQKFIRIKSKEKFQK